MVSCSDGPAVPPYSALIPDTDYWTYCSHRSGNVYLGYRSVFPLDVVRFLWERVRLDSGLTMMEVGDSYEDLYHDLPVIHVGDALETAAGSHGANTSDWQDAAADHGVDH